MDSEQVGDIEAVCRGAVVVGVVSKDDKRRNWKTDRRMRPTLLIDHIPPLDPRDECEQKNDFDRQSEILPFCHSIQLTLKV